MSDDPLRTIVVTDEGELPFQRYFVERRCEPHVKALRFDRVDQARPSPEFEEALERAGALLFCPSNPFLSIAPILAVRGVKERIARFPGTRVAVSPIVRGEALRGPAAKILSELGHDVSCVGVARQYRGLCDLFVIDEQDSHHSEAIQELGMQPEVTQTIMSTAGDRVNLAMSLRRLLKV
jgi:LPPG:FO 2-phospho-L-lactate transferase